MKSPIVLPLHPQALIQFPNRPPTQFKRLFCPPHFRYSSHPIGGMGMAHERIVSIPWGAYLSLLWRYGWAGARRYPMRLALFAALTPLAASGPAICSGLINRLLQQAEQVADRENAANFFVEEISGQNQVLGLPEFAQPAVAQLLNGLSGGEYTAVTLAVISATFIVIWLTNVQRLKLAARVNFELRRDASQAMLSYDNASSIDHGKQNEAGFYAKALFRAADTTEAAFNAILSSIVALATIVVTLLSISTASPLAVYVAGGVILLFAILSASQARTLWPKRTALDDNTNTLSAKLDDILSRRESIIANDSRAPYLERLEQGSADLTDLEYRIAKREDAYRNSYQALGQFGVVLLVVAATVAVYIGGGVNTPSIGSGASGAFLLMQLFQQLLAPVTDIISGIDSAISSKQRSNYLYAVLQRARSVARMSRASFTPHWIPGAPIKFLDVAILGRDHETIVVGPFTETIEPGRFTLIHGPSGSGKSTIVRALMNFAQLRSGEISIGGTDPRWLSPETLYENVFYAAQQPHLLEGAIAENLALGKYVASERSAYERFSALIAMAGLADRLPDPQSLDGPVKELSEGQQQRLSFIRAFLESAEVLIFDEPLTGVDAAMFEKLMHALKHFAAGAGKTVIVVSHRAEMRTFADTIISVPDVALKR
jgi:ABC-type multidrug transport system fused ATPase/permease subunit